MPGILDGLRVIEGSAYVAAPLGGMTLAQLGADVIRFDQIGGGLDRNRWPVTEDGASLFWAGLNKGKRSLQVDLRSDRGRELVTALISEPGRSATPWRRSARSSIVMESVGAPTRRSCSWSTKTAAARPRTRCSGRSSNPGSAPI